VTATPGEVVRQFCAAFASRCTNDLRPFLTPHTVFENVPLEGDARRVVGADEITRRLQAKLDLCVEVEFRIVTLLEGAGQVFTERVDTFRFPDGTFPKSDTQQWEACTRWDVADGKIVLWRDYYDLLTNERQTGVPLAEYRGMLDRARRRQAPVS